VDRHGFFEVAGGDLTAVLLLHCEQRDRRRSTNPRVDGRPRARLERRLR
jgi:hypothetical protein